VSEHDPKTGVISFKTEPIKTAAMLRILPGRGNAVKCHRAVLDCPGVRRALRRHPKHPPRLRLR
jgi:hypothetical protein